MGHHPLSPKQVPHHSHTQTPLLRSLPKKESEYVTDTDRPKTLRQKFLFTGVLLQEMFWIGLYYARVTITQNTLTISHYDPI